MVFGRFLEDRKAGVVPLLAVGLVLGQGHVLSQLAWFFSKLALVTFGFSSRFAARPTSRVLSRGDGAMQHFRNEPLVPAVPLQYSG